MAVQAKVYVVDDDQGMRDSTVWLLQSVGLQALPFAGGQAFLDACVDDGPACVLLDVRMPGLGGLAVQQAMRERGLALPVTAAAVALAVSLRAAVRERRAGYTTRNGVHLDRIQRIDDLFLCDPDFLCNFLNSRFFLVYFDIIFFRVNGFICRITK